MTFRWHLMQIGRALSRLFNACLGGEGDTTTSANSYKLMLVGKSRLGIPARYWVRLIDWLTREPKHCEKGYLWHNERRLFQDDIH